MILETIKKFNFNVNGKRILILAGVHGNEIGTIKLAFDLINYYDKLSTLGSESEFPEDIASITIIPICNFNGLRDKSRNQTYYGNDLNREWIDSFLARPKLTEEISNNDIILDLHSSTSCSNQFLLDIEMNYINEIIGTLESLDINYMVQSSYNSTIKRYCDHIGKICLTWEQNGISGVDKDANFNAFKTIVMLLNNVSNFYNSRYVKNTDEINICEYIHSPSEGLFIPLFDNNMKISKNDFHDNKITIGYIDNLVSNKKRDVYLYHNDKSIKEYSICFISNSVWVRQDEDIAVVQGYNK